jgi:tetratricopeptide (TPR) repeat protein
VRESLQDDRRNCVLKRIGLGLTLGRHDELLGELRQLRAHYPDDQICAEHEMTALFWSGRQAEALEVFQRVRALLGEQGIDPGPRLVAHHQRILRGDLEQPKAPRRPVSADRVAPVPRRNTAFVGREADLRRLTAAGPGDPSVWIISGLPGVGKTSLAVEAATRLADEVLYLEFHANEVDQSPLGADAALCRLLEMAGVHRSGLPRGQKELASLWQREAASRRMAIVLDDVPDANSVKQLLPEAGPCRVFVTTRHRLRGLAGASELSLDVLPEEEAIALFRQIAGTGADDDSAAAAAAVRQCGYLPYAIAITAGRIRPDSGLTSPGGSADSGVETMNDQVLSVLNSSYQAMSEQEQRLVRFLGMNVCPSFSAESAAVMANLPVSVAAAMISALLDRHLIERAAGGGFRLHDLLRDYVSARAALEVPKAARRDAERRLLDHYLSRVDRADRDLYPHRRHSALPLPRSDPDSGTYSRRWLELEWRNALKIAEHAGRHERQQDCAELTHMLAGFLEIEGYWSESIDAHGRALRACRDLGDQRRTARALLDLSRACVAGGLREDAFTRADQALGVYRSLGDQNGEAAAIGFIGVINLEFGNVRDMQACERDARSLYVRSGDITGEAEASFHLGIACLVLGQIDEALENLRKSLDIFERSGNWRGAASVLNSMAEVSLREGRHRDALANYERALSMWREMGGKQNSAIVRLNIGRVYLYKESPGRALAEFKCALAEFRQLRDFPWRARAMCDCGDACLAMDDRDQGRTYYEQAVSAATEVGDMAVRATALRGTADVYRESDRIDEAMRRYQEALKVAQDVEDPFQRAMVLDGMAKTMLRAGKISTGRIRLRQARDLYRTAGATEAARSADLRLHMLGDPTSDWLKLQLPTA